MSNSTRTEAIVLRKRSLLGQDVLITFFSRELGKVSAIAKGIKKITSRRASHTQTGNLVDIQLSDKNAKHYLQESKLISAFSSVKASEEKVDLMYLLFFILDRLLPDLQQEPALYIMVKRCLVNLSNNPKFGRGDLLPYLQETLSILGYEKKGLSWNETMRVIEEIIHEKLPARII